jgi:2'-5' RNA ligase
METARVYAACLLDLAATRRVAELSRALRRNAKAKGWEAAFVPPPSLHVTLRWLGDIDLGLVAPVIDALHATAQNHPPLRLQLSGVVAGPSPDAPRFLGAGVTQGTELLRALAADLDAALAALGFDAADDAPRPWIPLARVTRADGPISALLPGGGDVGPATVSEVALYRAEAPRADIEPAALARFTLCAKPRAAGVPTSSRQ